MSPGTWMDAGAPRMAVPSLSLRPANGEFAFFDTPAALVPADVDGEVAPNERRTGNGEYNSTDFSPSSDVYEWREIGVDGCAQRAGLSGVDHLGSRWLSEHVARDRRSGRDVFIYTSSQLVPQDNDTAGDIYDARIGGGFPPPPPPPVECEGDACSTPLARAERRDAVELDVPGAGNVASEPPARGEPKSQSPKHRRPKREKRRRRQSRRRGEAGKQKREGKAATGQAEPRAISGGQCLWVRTVARLARCARWLSLVLSAAVAAAGASPANTRLKSCPVVVSLSRRPAIRPRAHDESGRRRLTSPTKQRQARRITTCVRSS